MHACARSEYRPAVSQAKGQSDISRDFKATNGFFSWKKEPKKPPNRITFRCSDSNWSNAFNNAKYIKTISFSKKKNSSIKQLLWITHVHVQKRKAKVSQNMWVLRFCCSCYSKSELRTFFRCGWLHIWRCSDYLNKSNVTPLPMCFYWCLDNTGWDISNWVSCNLLSMTKMHIIISILKGAANQTRWVRPLPSFHRQALMCCVGDWMRERNLPSAACEESVNPQTERGKKKK